MNSIIIPCEAYFSNKDHKDVKISNLFAETEIFQTSGVTEFTTNPSMLVELSREICEKYVIIPPPVVFVPSDVIVSPPPETFYNLTTESKAGIGSH